MDFGLDFVGDSGPTLDQLLEQLDSGEAFEQEGEFVVADTDPVKLIQCFEGTGVEDKSLKYLLMNLVSMLLPREDRKIEKICGVEVQMPIRLTGEEIKFHLNSLRNFANAADSDVLSQLEEGGVIPLLGIGEEPDFSVIGHDGLPVPVYLTEVSTLKPFPDSQLARDVAMNFGIAPGEAVDTCVFHRYIFGYDPTARIPLSRIKDAELSAVHGHGCVPAHITVEVRDKEKRLVTRVVQMKDGTVWQPISRFENTHLECKPSSTPSRSVMNANRRMRFVTGGSTYYLSAFLSWLLMISVRERTKFGKRDCDRVKSLEHYRSMIAGYNAVDARKEFERIRDSTEEDFKSDKLAMLTRRVADLSYKQSTLQKYEITRTRDTNPLEEHVKSKSRIEKVSQCQQCKKSYFHLCCIHCAIGLDYYGKCLVCVGVLKEGSSFYQPVLPKVPAASTGRRRDRKL